MFQETRQELAYNKCMLGLKYSTKLYHTLNGATVQHYMNINDIKCILITTPLYVRILQNKGPLV